MTKKRRNDFIFIGALLLTALLIWLLFVIFAPNGEFAVISQNGNETARYPLNSDTTVRLDSTNGGYNILEIKDGFASITEASCPDKLCVNQHKISKKNETIVCLPNNTVISIDSENEADADFIG